MGKSFNNVRGGAKGSGNARVKEAKGGQRNFDTYEALRNCKSGGQHKQGKGDRKSAERDAIEASIEADDE